MLQIPTKFPTNGFYYHYKHAPEKGVRDYAYYICGIGFHTEDNCEPRDATMAVYQPLYESASVYQASLAMGVPAFDLRPLGMLLETVAKDGGEVPRFLQITDPEIIRELEVIRKEMYK